MRGTRLSKTFATKGAAQQWGTREESALRDGSASRWPPKTLAQAINRYERDITPSKGGATFERVAFGLMRREYPSLLAKVLHTITPGDLAEWRDDRLKTVSGSTVHRYVGLLRNVWTVAAREWGWCPEPSPWRSVKLPMHNPPRERLIGWREARQILRRLNFQTGVRPTTKMQFVAYAWLVALRTGLRASEVLSLTPEAIHGRVVTLAQHKTKHITGRARHVPVTKQAARLLALCLPLDVSTRSLDALFRKARDQVGVEGLTFHDSRATALTMLSRRVDVLTLARISGHRDLRMLQVYYRESNQSIAERL